MSKRIDSKLDVGKIAIVPMLTEKDQVTSWLNRGPGEGAALSLRDKLNHFYWGTAGRYLPRNMLRAFMEELGGQYEGLLAGASNRCGDQALLHTAAAQVKAERHDDSDSNSDLETTSDISSDKDEMIIA